MIPGLLRFGFAKDVNNLIELGDDEKELFPEHLSGPHHLFVVIRLFLHQIPQVRVDGLRRVNRVQATELLTRLKSEDQLDIKNITSKIKSHTGNEDLSDEEREEGVKITCKTRNSKLKMAI